MESFLQRVADETESIFWGGEHTYVDFMRLLRGAAFQLSGRYHHVILGARVGCPAVAFAGASHKVHGVCELLDGLVGQPYDSGELGALIDEIVDRCTEIVSRGRDLREQLIERSQVLGRETAALGDMLADILRSLPPRGDRCER